MKAKVPFDRKQLESTVKGIQGIAHPVRLMILILLSKEEKSVGQIVETLGASQSATSQHLSKMKNNGILNCRKESNQVFYFLKNSKFKDLATTIQSVFKK